MIGVRRCRGDPPRTLGGADNAPGVAYSPGRDDGVGRELGTSAAQAGCFAGHVVSHGVSAEAQFVGVPHLRPAASARLAQCHDEPCVFSGLMSGSQLVPGATR
jgi:hypothetical protein